MSRDVADSSCTVEIHVQKVRFKEIDKVGLVHMEYDLAVVGIDRVCLQGCFQMKEYHITSEP